MINLFMFVFVVPNIEQCSTFSTCTWGQFSEWSFPNYVHAHDHNDHLI